jgi:hypothetical protein
MNITRLKFYLSLAVATGSYDRMRTHVLSMYFSLFSDNNAFVEWLVTIHADRFLLHDGYFALCICDVFCNKFWKMVPEERINCRYIWTVMHMLVAMGTVTLNSLTRLRSSVINAVRKSINFLIICSGSFFSYPK